MYKELRHSPHIVTTLGWCDRSGTVVQEVLTDTLDIWRLYQPNVKRLCGDSPSWRVTFRRILGIAKALSALDDVGWLLCDFTYDQFACSADNASHIKLVDLDHAPQFCSDTSVGSRSHAGPVIQMPEQVRDFTARHVWMVGVIIQYEMEATKMPGCIRLAIDEASNNWFGNTTDLLLTTREKVLSNQVGGLRKVDLKRLPNKPPHCDRWFQGFARRARGQVCGFPLSQRLRLQRSIAAYITTVIAQHTSSSSGIVYWLSTVSSSSSSLLSQQL